MAHDESPVEGEPSFDKVISDRPGRGRPAGRTGVSAVDVARRVLARVDAGAYATLALSGELARARLDDAGKGLCTELVYGCLRKEARVQRALDALAPRGLGRLDAQVLILLRLGAYQILFTRIPPAIATSQIVDEVSRLRGPKLAGFANALLRRLVREGEPPPAPLPGPMAKDADFAHALAKRHGLPEFLVADVVAQGDRAEAVALCEALDAPAPLWLRHNPLRGSRDEALFALSAEGIEVQQGPSLPLPLFPEALRLKSGHPFSGAAYGAGLFTAQDLGAQLVARLLLADTPDGPLRLPGDALPILDACAGVGGKTTHLAALTCNRRDIDAVDSSARKLELCQDHAHRLGCERVTTIVADLLDGAALKKRLRESYAAVLLDAPCSGVGVLRRHPEARRRLTKQSVDELAAVQRRLLKNLAGFVHPGGVLVYAVCSFLSAEGSEQIAAFLREHPEFTLLPPASEPPWSQLPWPLRTLPHRHDADGFYAVRLLRRK